MATWKTIPLSEYATVTMGQSPPSSTYNDNGVGTPFVQGNRTFQSRYCDIDTFTSQPTRIAKKGDVLLSVRAPVGDSNIAPVELCIGRGLAALDSIDENNHFLYYLLKSNRQKFENQESGTVFGSINKNIIQNTLVSIPDDPIIREKIGLILKTIDDAIEVNIRINDYFSLIV